MRHGRANRCVLLLLSFIALAVSCSKSTSPDITPPSTPTGLYVAAATETTITLAWVAGGDDGDRGQAARYDLRVNPSAAAAQWDSAEAVPGLPSPKPSGKPESFTVTGLQDHTIYYFALRALDGAQNASPFTDPVQGETSDPAPPAGITDLGAAGLAPHAFTLTFTAPGDDGFQGTAVAYIVRRSPDEITETGWTDAESLTVAIPPVPGGAPVSYRLEGLTPGTSLHYAVRARDDAGKTGPVSNDLLVSLPGDTVPPAAITDLAATSPGPFRVTLTWTAPGNDGDEGTAARYEVRYATAPVTGANWASATPVSGSPVPSAPGSAETMDVIPAPGGETLWFGVVAMDGGGNESPVSNSPSATVASANQVWHVYADSSGDAPTIQEAIIHARTGDMVLVGPGTYHEDIDFLGKGIYLKSQNGPDATILDGSQEDSSIVMLHSQEPIGTVLEGFTLRGGRGTLTNPLDDHREGGGIWCTTGSLVIRGNRMIQNTAVWGGAAAIGTYDLDPARFPTITVQGNLFADNVATVNGGAVWGYKGYFSVEDNVFEGNHTLSGDGGAYNAQMKGGALQIVRNLFLNNVADDQGGALAVGTSPALGAKPVTISENVMVHNAAYARGGGGAGSGGGIAFRGGDGFIDHNTIAYNTGATNNPYYGGGISFASTAVVST
jgi:hypothetical protein